MLASKHKKLIMLVSWTAVALWMAVIFALSAQPRERSNQLSTGITEKVVRVVQEVSPHTEVDIEELNHVVRKSAHFFVSAQ